MIIIVLLYIEYAVIRRAGARFFAIVLSMGVVCELFFSLVFLGEMSFKTKNAIYTIANNNNLEIVNLVNVEDEKKYITDSIDFVDYN